MLVRGVCACTCVRVRARGCVCEGGVACVVVRKCVVHDAYCVCGENIYNLHSDDRRDLSDVYASFTLLCTFPT